MTDHFDTEIALRVEGMMCQKSCGTTVYNAVMEVDGVKWAEVSFAEKTAKVCIKNKNKKLKLQVISIFCASLLHFFLIALHSSVMKIFRTLCVLSFSDALHGASVFFCEMFPFEQW